MRARLNDESGQALVLAIMIIVVGLLLAFGAVAYGLSVGQQGSHDAQRRAAQQGSDAGVQQQLYQESNVNAVGFNPTPGSVGTLAECVESNLGVSAGVNASTTLAQVGLSVGGVCPQQSCVAGTANCGNGKTPIWSSLDNGDYYDAEFCPNPEYQSTTATTPTAACSTPATGTNSSSLAVLFPEIISVGCHSITATCDTGSGANQYSKQLALLNPTAPLQAIEGENNVRINPTGGTQCSGLAVLGTCLGVTSIVNATIVDGNIVAGNALQVPSTTLGLSTTTAANLVSNVVNELVAVLGLGAIVTPLETDLGISPGQTPVSLTPTYEYGNCYGTTVTPASNVSSPTSTYKCTETSTNLNGSFVPTGLNNACAAGNPSTDCALTRPSFSVGSPAPTTSFATVSGLYTGGTLGTCPTATSAQLAANTAGNCYVNGDLSLTSGTLALTPGTYVFCSVNIGSGATLSGPAGASSGAVQIYVLSPGATQCNLAPAGTLTTGANDTQGASCSAGSDTEGNFIDATGVSNSLGGLVNTITSTVDPSNFQIYVAGDSGDSLTVNNNCQPRTQVNIGSSAVSLIQAYVVYAPRSNVTVATSTAFEGSAVGWNVNLTALAILQDLDLGNYPLSSVIDSYQVNQTVNCATNSVGSDTLAGTSADLASCG